MARSMISQEQIAGSGDYNDKEPLEEERDLGSPVDKNKEALPKDQNKRG